MPPRWLCVGIIASWLATTGWLVWSELRDEFAPDEPPPYVIDLVDEAQPELAHIRWVVWLGDEPRKDATFSGTTWTEHHEREDEFTLHVALDASLSSAGKIDLGLVKLKHMGSKYRVDRDGRLVSAAADFHFEPLGGGDASVHMEGEVRGGEFRGKYVLYSSLLGQREIASEPVPVSRQRSVLLPMHPVNRIGGLRPGQTWKMPLVNPLADAITGGPSAPRILHGRVLPEPQMLPVSRIPARRSKPISCLVIEYDGDDEVGPKPRTWVRAADGLVLRQEASLGDKRLMMQRDMIPDLHGEP